MVSRWLFKGKKAEKGAAFLEYAVVLALIAFIVAGPAQEVGIEARNDLYGTMWALRSGGTCGTTGRPPADIDTACAEEPNAGWCCCHYFPSGCPTDP